jgi:hypothetical protein
MHGARSGHFGSPDSGGSVGYCSFARDSVPSNIRCIHSEVSVGPFLMTASVVYRSEFLPTDPEVANLISGAVRVSEKYWVWNGAHSAS